MFIFVFLAALFLHTCQAEVGCEEDGSGLTSLSRYNRTYYPFHKICYAINVPDENGTDSLDLYLQLEFVASQVSTYESYVSNLCNDQSCCNLGRSITAFVPTMSVAGEFIQTHGLEVVTPQMIHDLYYFTCTTDPVLWVSSCPDFDGYTTYFRRGQHGGQCTDNQTLVECDADCTADPLCAAFDYSNDKNFLEGTCCLWYSHFSELNPSCSTCSYNRVDVVPGPTAAPMPPAEGVVVPAPSVAPMWPAEATADAFYVESDYPGLSSITDLEPMTEYYVLHGRYWECSNPFLFNVDDLVQVDIVETSSYDCLLTPKELYNWKCPEECDGDFCPFGAVCTLTCPGDLICVSEDCETEVRCVGDWEYINSTIGEPICEQAPHEHTYPAPDVSGTAVMFLQLLLISVGTINAVL